MSVVRSIRISKEVDATLHNDAKERRLTYNQLVSNILTKYSEWDRFAEKLGYVSNSTILYKQFVALIPDDKLEEIGIASSEMVKDALLILYKKTDIDSFLEYLSLVTKYAWGTSLRYDQKTDGKNCTLTFHHVFGKKWSIAFTSNMRQAIKDISGLEPKIVATENTLTFTFPVQPKVAVRD